MCYSLLTNGTCPGFDAASFPIGHKTFFFCLVFLVL